MDTVPVLFTPQSVLDLQCFTIFFFFSFFFLPTGRQLERGAERAHGKEPSHCHVMAHIYYFMFN